ncbi:hypothetical protein K458DRAFT_396991 [Lentithecium fluviatile CBS 122367]|uniref:Extracellular membrane protein CFEM domain-containing protein n=1 Tax=Lentithecium fluviatile CBS 122367 TaxID=1168545 RepID=A0A6G1IDV5_9PLEO|nr:hypothetical protein K458DRAFT_396991 [Lentithecium fluviatile CBS 122367]
MPRFSIDTPTPRIIYVLLLSHAAISQLTGTVSIWEFEEWGSQRKCARECFQCFNAGAYDCIAAILDWDDRPAYNNCYCRADLQLTASSYLSSCVSKACSNNADLSSAMSIHSTYWDDYERRAESNNRGAYRYRYDDEHCGGKNNSDNKRCFSVQ